MTLKQTIKHCIEKTDSDNMSYEFEEMEDRDDTVILHANTGFLSNSLTKELRKRLIFVDATGQLKPEQYGASFFLRYLEGQEDTFLDDLA